MLPKPLGQAKPSPRGRVAVTHGTQPIGRRLSGREVSLLADGDEPGHKAMKGLAVHLSELGCKVKIALPPVEWDSDIADWLETKGKAGAAKIVLDLLKDFKPPTVQTAIEKTIEDSLKEGAANELLDNEHYRLLGLVDTNVTFRLRKAGKIYQVTRKQMTKVDSLVAVAPADWWAHWVGVETLTSKAALEIGDNLIREADDLGEVDQSLFWGRGATQTTGRQGCLSSGR